MLVLLVVTVAALAAGCGPTITMPDVVGMRLDEAHRTLEKLDVTNFDDVDVVGEKDSIWLDKNWVVVAQDPPAGTRDVDTGTTIELSVGNEDETDEVLALIPVDSPFAEEVAADRAEAAEEAAVEREEAEAEAREEAAEQAAEEAAEVAQRRADAREYATNIDEALARDVRSVVLLYLKNVSYVRSGDRSGPDDVTVAGNVMAARDFFEQTISLLTTSDVAAPDSLGLDGVDEQLRAAMASMSLACDALLDAIDTGAASAVASEDRWRAEAVADWNAAMRDIYGAAGRRPVLLPTGP